MDDINLGQCIREISEIQGVGNIVGLLVNVEWWKEGYSGRDRASIKHPVVIQFDTERGAQSAAREFRRDYKRTDRGGRRTLLLEHSNREMDISVKTLVCDGLRVGLGKDVDFFLQPWLVNKGTDQHVLLLLTILLASRLVGVLAVPSDLRTVKAAVKCLKT